MTFEIVGKVLFEKPEKLGSMMKEFIEKTENDKK